MPDKNNRIKLSRAVVVEGKYDKIKLSALVDAVIIVTNGFGIYKNSGARRLVRTYAEKQGLIVMTDSDAAGRKIRGYIKSILPKELHERVASVHIPQIEYTKRYAEPETPLSYEEQMKASPSKQRSAVIVDGIDDCVVKFAQCCNQLPGDEIVGFITRGHGISVHKSDCVNYLLQKDSPEQAERWIAVRWEQTKAKSEYFKTTLDVIAVDRIGLLADVSSALAMINIYIYESTSRELKNGNAILTITISVAGTEQLNNVIAKLKKINNVISVERSGR